MAGRLAIDFGNAYTVAAYWHQASRQAETLYLPGVMRPMPGRTLGKHTGIYAAPSVIARHEETGEWLIGQEALESSCAQMLPRDLQFAVITGKQVNAVVGNRFISMQELAKEYLAAIISRSGQVLGLGSEAVLAFTMPLAVCRSEAAWRRYKHWLEGTVRQAGFNRLELIEQPWAAAWGAGMRVAPEDRYMVFTITDAYLEAAMVHVNQTGAVGNGRYSRIVSYGSAWLTGEETEGALTALVAALSRQVLREAAVLGYMPDNLAGVIVTGNVVNAAILTALQECFAGVVMYSRVPLAAAACGAAVLSAGLDGCGYLRYGYTVRYLGEDGYHYREVMPQGMFYPSDKQAAELIIKAGYDGQQEFAVLLYRGEEQCINEDNPLLLTLAQPAARLQPVIRLEAGLDGTGQLLVTAYDLASGDVIADTIVAAKLV